MSIISLLTSVLQLVLLIIGKFTKTPDEKKDEFVVGLASALKKAKDEKDPSDLSKLINNFK